MNPEESGAIILAGGQSERMGQDKAMLPFAGMTLLEYILTTVLTIASNVVVVADRPGKYSLSGCQVVADTFPDSGPVGGIVTGLMTLGPGSHIVVGCDMPGINPQILQLLLKAATPEWDAVVPEVNQLPEPLCAVYRHTAAPKLLGYLESGKHSAREALKLLNTKKVGEGVLRRIDPQLDCFININTPEDLEDFLAKSLRK